MQRPFPAAALPREWARDPVCEMAVAPGQGTSERWQGQTVAFCSDLCRERFLAAPERYATALTSELPELAPGERRIAYFAMEVGLVRDIPTYAGGLGVLAGDMLRSLADLEIPAVGVTLLCREGQPHQRFDQQGTQREEAARWEPEPWLEPLAATAEVEVEGRGVRLRGWCYPIAGRSGFTVPLLFVDSDLPGNAPQDRALSGTLYGGDDRYRLAQEVLLGIGGARLLAAAGYSRIERFHMNEGHAALLALELLRRAQAGDPDDWGLHAVRERCVFTTHTPVVAGHDQFDYELVRRVAGELVPPRLLRMLGGPERLNLTVLGLNASGFVNGVARRHGEVSRGMFPGHAIHYITNGVHSRSWTSGPLRALFDRYLPGWSEDPAMLRHALRLPAEELWAAHLEAKAELLHAVRERTGVALAAEPLLVGFARRATAYKRADLVVSDLDRLRAMARATGPLQVLFAGKAHPRDAEGKRLIERIVTAGAALAPDVPVVYLPDYDLELAARLVSGSDLWLNTPEPPLEASGTSGMKAAHNGVPSLSVVDGWWGEGLVEGVTGWAIENGDGSRAAAAESLYRKLESVVLPLYHRNREGWIDVMRHAIALNASHFNTHRMVQQYAANAYV
jgi:starch phosphorylase